MLPWLGRMHRHVLMLAEEHVLAKAKQRIRAERNSWEGYQPG